MNALEPICDFSAWVEAAAPGDQIVYFSGYLDHARFDAACEPFRENPRRVEIPPRLVPAHRALEAALSGRVDLAQRRAHVGFDYVAIRRALARRA